MRNYELGIVIPLPANDLERAINNVVCWKRPARPYGTDVPWVRLLCSPSTSQILTALADATNPPTLVKIIMKLQILCCKIRPAHRPAHAQLRSSNDYNAYTNEHCPYGAYNTHKLYTCHAGPVNLPPVRSLASRR